MLTRGKPSAGAQPCRHPSVSTRLNNRLGLALSAYQTSGAGGGAGSAGTVDLLELEDEASFYGILGVVGTALEGGEAGNACCLSKHAWAHAKRTLPRV